MKFRDSSGRVLLAKVEEAREMDRLTVEEFGMPGQLLMELAGLGTTQVIEGLFGGGVGRATILCGGGNNAGDGYVVARHLLGSGWDVVVLSSTSTEHLRGDCRLNFDRYKACGGEVSELVAKVTARAKNRIKHADVVIDALFGVGLSRPVEGVAEELILAANQATHGFKVSVDVPSGIDADRGGRLGAAFCADHTVTYGLEKPGLYLGAGRSHAGVVHRCEIGIPDIIAQSVSQRTGRLDERGAAQRLPHRSAQGHKGTYGHVGVVGGFSGKEGAAVLAALGAMHGAAGLVTWMGCGGFDAVKRPAEIMTRDWNSDGLEPRVTVLVVGPGMGQTETAKRALSDALASGKPCVLDADALNILAQDTSRLGTADVVLTPHPAEAARLLGWATVDVTQDPVRAAATIATTYRATVLLKGSESVVSDALGVCTIVHEGDATLSIGGTGDVLSGLVAAYIAQGLSLPDAAMLGAFVHGRAGKLLGVQTSQRGVTATEIACKIPGVIGQLDLVWNP